MKSGYSLNYYFILQTDSSGGKNHSSSPLSPLPPHSLCTSMINPSSRFPLRVSYIYFARREPLNVITVITLALTDKKNFTISRSQPRQRPHDSSRCEACKNGSCSQMTGYGYRGPRQPRHYSPPVNGHRINWILIVRFD